MRTKVALDSDSPASQLAIAWPAILAHQLRWRWRGGCVLESDVPALAGLAVAITTGAVGADAEMLASAMTTPVSVRVSAVLGLG